MRFRFIVAFSLVVLVTLASVVVILWNTTQREVDSFMFRGGMVGLEELVQALEKYYQNNSSWEGVETFFHQMTVPGRRLGQGAGHGTGMMLSQRMRLYEADGKIVADTRELRPTGRLEETATEEAIALRSGRRVVGYLLYEGGMSFTARDQVNLLARLNRSAITAAVIGGAFSLLLAGLLSYRLARPIQILKQGAEQLAAGDLSQRVSLRGDAELASLGTAFNQMAASLQKAESNRRAITADIAHELRTPLSVQRAHLEAIQDGIYPLTPDNLDPVLAQNLLLTRLVEDLRTLALADAGQLTLDLTAVDLVTLAAKVVERFRLQASAKQVFIEFIQPSQIIPQITGDPARIEQIISNLLTNALRHTADKSKISLSLKGTSGKVQLSVRDNGQGIPDNALPNIFDRFYRADPSRSREEGGSGLGLSIARQLARAHRGDLNAANHPEGGAVFTLTLPSIG